MAMRSIEEQIEFNEACQCALVDACDEISWLVKYQSLYKSCSIQPEGRPSISIAFHQGAFFEDIDKFVTKYSSIINPKDSSQSDEF